jgi:hypothetical protein
VTSPKVEPSLPNLLIIGVAKAGTTSMYRYLGQHPDIGTADAKELRYFSALRYGEELGPIEGYSKHFEHCTNERYRMEATPGYYAGGRTVADAIETMLPSPRVLVLFRDPVDRCWSWFRFVRSTARIPKDMGFSEYIQRCEELNREGVDGQRVNQPFWGLGGGCYDNWLEAWLDVFGDRFRVGFFEDLVRDPRAATEETCRWLGIDPSPCATVRYHVENKTVQYKNKPLQKAALAVNRHSERFFTRHPGVKRALRSAYYRVNSEDFDNRMTVSERDRLREFYAPHNERLAAMLADAGHRACPDWLVATRVP